jgi:hypothetical protein
MGAFGDLVHALADRSSAAAEFSMPTFDQVLTRIRLHYILGATAQAHYELGTSRCTYAGTAEAGSFSFDRGDGSQLWASWGGPGVVLLAFDAMVDDRQLKRPVAQRDVSVALGGCPGALAGQVEEVSAASGRLASAGLWALRGGSTDGFGHVDVLDGFIWNTPETARNLAERFSVSAKQADLAENLAARATGAPVVLTPAEVKVLRKPPRPELEAPESHWKVATAMLRTIGVFTSAAAV